MRRDFQLQSLSLQTRLQQKFWSQERNKLVQESQQLKQSLLLLSLKLRWFLKQWRLGKKLEGDAQDILEVRRSQGLKPILYSCYNNFIVMFFSPLEPPQYNFWVQGTKSLIVIPGGNDHRVKHVPYCL